MTNSQELFTVIDDLMEEHKRLTPPWGPIGYITYKRTYSRRLPSGQTEEWYQTVGRCCKGIVMIGADKIFTVEEITLLYKYVFNLKCCFSGRSLWQLGTEKMMQNGADSLTNCWGVVVNSLDAFTFTFDELMLGGGVGFTILPQFVYELPIVKYDPEISRLDEGDVGFIVPDNREGWVELLRKVLDAFFTTGQNFTFSTMCVREAGATISGFGGTASGPEELVRGINNIMRVLRTRIGQKLRPIDCLDIQNIIGKIVVSGNIRRSSELGVGDVEDTRFLAAKDWASGVPTWRAMSNNSISADSTNSLPDTFWKGFNGSGEPCGLVNFHNMRRFGRLADGIDYRPDYGIMAVNPCGEVGLEPYEGCNLGEIFLPNLENDVEFYNAARLVYKVTKIVSCFKFQNPVTNAVVSRNHRLGIGITGFMQKPAKANLLNTIYRSIELQDIECSSLLGVTTSVKLTTVKPSGTLSLLAGVTPGAHRAYAPYCIRRVRFSSDDPLVEVCRRNKYKTEPALRQDGSIDLLTTVVEFPVAYNVSNEECAGYATAIEQLETLKFLQTNWSDNSVSITIYYKQTEIAKIKEWLNKNYAEGIKSVSFCLHSEHGYVQAPFEEISQETYMTLTNSLKPITNIIDTGSFSLHESLECATGSCPIK